jgi:hypothetical protein
VAVSVINLAQFDRLLIAIIPLNLLCHISLRFNGMSYDDPLTHCTGKQRCYLCKEVRAHPVCVKTADSNIIAVVLLPLTVSALYRTILVFRSDCVHCLIICIEI